MFQKMGNTSIRGRGKLCITAKTFPELWQGDQGAAQQDADAKRDESRGGYSDFADIYVEW